MTDLCKIIHRKKSGVLINNYYWNAEGDLEKSAISQMKMIATLHCGTRKYLVTKDYLFALNSK